MTPAFRYLCISDMTRPSLTVRDSTSMSLLWFTVSKYFDTLNHEILINLLRRNVKDERVVQLIKRYLKSGVMENGVVIDTEEGSPQGGVCKAYHSPPYAKQNTMQRKSPLSL